MAGGWKVGQEEAKKGENEAREERRTVFRILSKAPSIFQARSARREREREREGEWGGKREGERKGESETQTAWVVVRRSRRRMV